MGLRLYKKLGFRELDGIEVDLSEYGWKGTEGRMHIHGESLFGVSFHTGCLSEGCADLLALRVVAMIKEPVKEQETIEGCETARGNSVERLS
jgi:hypothetical protein